MNFVINHSYLIPLLPLIAAAISGFFGAQYLKGKSHWPIWIAVGISALLSLILLFGMIGHVGLGALEHGDKPFGQPVDWFTWISTGGTGPGHFTATAGAWFDPLTAIMLSVVCGIGFLITIFAAGYMKGEEGYFRFFAYLGMFIFAMTCLVMGNNLVMLYLGWEGVGLCSYLLIGYYYDKNSAREAARKAFLVNRIGDFGFGIGIMLTFLVFGTVSYFGQGVGTFTGFIELATPGGAMGDNPFIAALPEWKRQLIPWIPFCLMVGAFGKSAQFPLYVWLPDAMEGPTPVSALIHAATMVTAGVYMIARCSTLFVLTPAATATVAAVGAFTALFAGTIALRQFDLKKVFAYSTVSQLGFMFAGVGLLAPVAGVFHLVTHAFFKALLFLSSGIVMHAMAGELDMRKMSGLRRVLPKTRLLMLVGCFALAGMFPLSGFWSKDEIVAAAFGQHTRSGTIVGVMLLFTAFLTAYYTFRLYFRVFEGPLVVPAEAEEHLGHVAHHATHSAPAHEPAAAAHGADAAHSDHGHHDPEPPLMIYPLFVLAAGAVLVGFINTPWWHGLGSFLGHSPSFTYGFHTAWLKSGGMAEPAAFGQHSTEHHTAWGVMLLSLLIAALGIVLAYYLHLAERRKAEQIANAIPGIAKTLENKYWVDELYDLLIVRPLRAMGVVFFWIDRFVVDTTVWLVSFIPQAGGWMLKLGVQRGYLQGYAAVMLFGLAVILLIIFL